MAYGDYRDAATLLDTCDVLIGDTPGKNVGCRFLGQAEPATTAATNRGPYALAENMDNLKLPLDSQIAITQVAALAAFSGNTIDIDMTAGAAGDINFSPVGYLYMGNGSYSGASQEDFDTLFQLLDEDFNEVIVDGDEVKITGISVGPALGSGFYNTAMVTLQLSATLPSGDYRLSYGRDSSLATLPDDALIRADIRGLHEAAAESGYKSVRVVAETNAIGPADFIGTSALEDALDHAISIGGNTTLFCRPGSYVFSAAYDISQDNIKIVGEGGVNLDFQSGAYDLTVSGDGVCFTDCTLLFSTSGGSGIRWDGDRGKMDHCDVSFGELDVTGDHFSADTVDCQSTAGVSNGLILNGVSYTTLRNCEFDVALGKALSVETAVCDRLVAENCIFKSDDLACFDVQIDLEYSKFTSCRFESEDATCFNLADTLRRSSFHSCEFSAQDGLALYVGRSDFYLVEFHNCRFESVPGTLTSSGIVDCYLPTGYPSAITQSSSQSVGFYNCEFTDDTATVRYQNPAVRLVSVLADSAEQMFIKMENCSLRSDACGCNDGAGGEEVGFEMMGVMLHNSAINGANQADMYEDGPMFRFYNCRLDVVQLWVAASVTNAAVYSDGVCEVLAGTEAHDLKIIGGFLENNRPLLHIEGDGLHQAMPPLAGRAAVVDGLEVMNYGIAHWTNAQFGEPLVVRMGVQSVLRRFIWDWNNVAGVNGTSSIQPQCLVRVTGDDVEISQCEIYPPSTGGHWLKYMIFAGDPVDNLRILHNVFKMADGRSSGVGMSCIIRLQTSAGQLTAPIIHGNYIKWYDDAAPPVNANQAIIALGTDVVFAKVTGNHIFVDNISTGTGIVIYLDEQVYPAGAGTDGGGSIVQGNTIFNDNDSGIGSGSGPGIAPDIYDGSGPGSTIIGQADNLLGYVP